MISKTVRRFCNEDISLIENYDEAINSFEKYDCHHRKEIDEGLTRQEMIDKGLYFNRPANELIFLTHNEHAKLHNRCGNSGWRPNNMTEERRKKVSEKTKEAMHRPEVREKVINGLKEKMSTPEMKKKLSESHTGYKWYKDELTGKRIFYRNDEQ